jgi:hypothetical protein
MLKLFGLFALLIVVALIGAGTMYWSESLIQASLYRFSIYPKLLACVGTSCLICRLWPRVMAAIAVVSGAALAFSCVIYGPYLGEFQWSGSSQEYEDACAWVQANTPVDAVFLVPPSDERFRLLAQRAIVVNFKSVPQLSGELVEWRRRMETTLDLSDIRMLPRPFGKTQVAMSDRYSALPASRLAEIARRYGARYIFTPTRLDASLDANRVEMNGNAEWFLYDLQHGSEEH